MRLTGNWSDDSNIIKLSIKNSENVIHDVNSLIPILGPSASGKSYWSKKLISYLGNFTGKVYHQFLNMGIWWSINN